MSMLARYRKSGGFIQLLTLIETTAKAKQDNFMQMIEKEDPRWAAAIREKMITIEKIFSWENAILAEIAARLQEIVLATVTHGLKPEDAERLMSTFSHSQKRMIDDLKKEKTPTPAEVNSGYLKMLTEVRNMITNGYIRVEKFAPEMEISKNIEEELGRSIGAKTKEDAPGELNFDAVEAPVARGAAGAGAAGNSADVTALRTRLQSVTNENNLLKKEVGTLREKLAQIKKIA